MVTLTFDSAFCTENCTVRHLENVRGEDKVAEVCGGASNLTVGVQDSVPAERRLRGSCAIDYRKTDTCILLIFSKFQLIGKLDFHILVDYFLSISALCNVYCWRRNHYLFFPIGTLKCGDYSHERIYFSVSFQPRLCLLFKKSFTSICLNFPLRANFLQHNNLIVFPSKICISLTF